MARTQPDRRGHFGIFGGRYAAETLMPALLELEAAYRGAKRDAAFKKEFAGLADSQTIPKSVYGTAADTPTLAFWNMFVAPAAMPDDLAYAITKAVFENLGPLQASVKAAKDTTVENSARFVGKTAIPFHPGAAKYFAEKTMKK